MEYNRLDVEEGRPKLPTLLENLAMETVRAYWAEPLRFEFTADIVRQLILPDGRRGVVLSTTFFYPTGGGQEHDIGALGEANVTDVLNGESGEIVHVVDREIKGSEVLGRIDSSRRLGLMQHHSGQHLLTQAFERAASLETVSAKISIDSPSTIDLATRSVPDEALYASENLANTIIYEDRAIKSYLVAEDKVNTVPLRRPPKVEGSVRVVEIDSFDYSACGGTHCPRTGMIGVLKILRTENRGDEVRIHFVAGERALRQFQEDHATVMRLAQEFDARPGQLIDLVQKQRDALRAAQKELNGFESAHMLLEAKKLLAQAEPIGRIRLIAALMPNRTPQQLRAIGVALQDEPGIIAILATLAGDKVSAVVSCAPDTGRSADGLLRTLLAQWGGRGGGDDGLAQGGAKADGNQLAEMLAHVRDHIITRTGAIGGA